MAAVPLLHPDPCLQVKPDHPSANLLPLQAQDMRGPDPVPEVPRGLDPGIQVLDQHPDLGNYTAEIFCTGQFSVVHTDRYTCSIHLLDKCQVY